MPAGSNIAVTHQPLLQKLTIEWILRYRYCDTSTNDKLDDKFSSKCQKQHIKWIMPPFKIIVGVLNRKIFSNQLYTVFYAFIDALDALKCSILCWSLFYIPSILYNYNRICMDLKASRCMFCALLSWFPTGVLVYWLYVCFT